MARTSVKGKTLRVTDGTAAVEDFMRGLDHPLKPVLEAVRRAILGANRDIREGIKWNAPSFQVKEYFATASIRSGYVNVIFHMGAKVKDNSTEGIRINDPAGLLEWLARERCIARFNDLNDVKSKEPALKSIVNQWIRRMRP